MIAIIQRLHLDGPTATLTSDLARARAALWDALTAPIQPQSRLAGLLRPYSAAGLGLLQASTPTQPSSASLPPTRPLAALHPLLTGADLAALGVPRGPRFGELLAALRDARLDGQLTTRADEERFIRRALAHEP